ncbi:MAG: AIR synthase-related protein, partial [Candidatus Hermodarchaeia archaeon]
FSDVLKNICTEKEIKAACDYLYNPGISVVRDARIAVDAGGITAMHDPTEGGLAGALWELAIACTHSLVVEPQSIPISPVSLKICKAFKIDPLGTIASGALLLTVSPEDSTTICQTLKAEGIPCVEIGSVKAGPPNVLQSISEGTILLHRPERDEIARLFER